MFYIFFYIFYILFFKVKINWIIENESGTWILWGKKNISSVEFYNYNKIRRELSYIRKWNKYFRANAYPEMPLTRSTNDSYMIIKVKESLYILLFVVSGSIRKLFSIGYFNIYIFSIISNRFCPEEKYGVIQHSLYRDSLILISLQTAMSSLFSLWLRLKKQHIYVRSMFTSFGIVYFYNQRWSSIIITKIMALWNHELSGIINYFRNMLLMLLLFWYIFPQIIMLV